MYVIFDHITSVVIGAIVLLLLAVLHVRTQDGNVDAIRGETNRARMLDLVHVLERDLRNAGSGVSGPAILSWSAAAPTPGAPVSVLEFYTTVDTSAAAVPSRLRYDLAMTDSTMVQGRWVPLYELRRLEYRAGTYVQVSASSPTITAFELTLLDEADAPTTSPSAARAFTLRATTLSPFGADNITRDSRWDTTIWPVNLRPN